MNQKSNKWGVFGLMMAAFVLAQCGGATQLASTAEPVATEVPAKGEIRIAFVGEPAFDDLPVLVALDLLASQGYTVTPVSYAESDLAVTALIQGDAEFGTGGVRTHWAAASKDGGIATIMERVGNIWSVVAKTDINECADLAGKRVAVTSRTGITKVMLDAYVQATCPGVEFEELYLSGSGSSVAALAADEIDATVTPYGNVVDLFSTHPDQFHTIVDLETVLPHLQVTGLHVNHEYAASHPEVVKDFVRAVLTVHRQFADDPALVVSEASKHLELDPALIQPVAEKYLSLNAWDVNGGMDEAAVKDSIAFYEQSGGLDAGVTPEQVADLSYLNAVLDEIGRK